MTQYLLTVFMGVIIGLALATIGRLEYARWLERTLANTRQELAKLKDMRQQPWLQGATTEYHLQKKIKELETECNRLYGIGQELNARVRALEANVSKSVLRRLDAQLGDKPCDGDSRL